MPKDLERDLGLGAVFAISIGAMVGSGIFILPALAIGIAGPSVVLAYLLAGVLVLPAALSKSEMATAMPEAGGTYIYIERGMGPLLGTVAGVGTWFSLSFKGALALVGGVPYLVLLFDLPIKPVAIGLALVLIAVNLVGVKQTGRFQVAVVVVMLAALSWFIVGGAPSVDTARYGEFFGGGLGGLLAATGLVFVSYGGVTKVASVAEEVEDPDRVLPLGILGSLAFTTALYVLIVAIVVGVVDAAAIGKTLTPMAIAAEETLGSVGVVAVVVAAVLALVSTANAGILSSSRYPFAMSRDDLAPAAFSAVSDRFNTPTAAISLTGAVMLALIAFVPILEIAKLASAFKILVFALVNAALVAFREGDVDAYDPSFESPLYPWMQLFGVASGFLLLSQMGDVAILGAVVITLGGVAWYLLYARPRVRREGAAVDAVRRSVGRQAVEQTRETVTDGGGYDVLIPLHEGTTRAREAALLSLADALAAPHDGQVTVVQFDEVPDQTPLDAATEQSAADIEFERRTDELVTDLDARTRYGEVVSHDTRRAIVNFADEEGVDAILMEQPEPIFGAVFGGDAGWLERHAPCTLLFVRGDETVPITDVAVVTTRGPHDPEKIRVADAVASASGGAVHLVYAAGSNATETQFETVEAYHDELAALCSAPVTTEVVAIDDAGEAVHRAEDADLVVVGPGTEGRLRQSPVEIPDRPSVVVHPDSRDGLSTRILERVVF